ncbi:TAP42-like protein [Geopyxis carbonaria]|nr:TAP42-like protein [Geopyxis carbonaria]
MHDDNNNESIRSLFDAAEATKRTLESLYDSNSDQYQQSLQIAITKYQKCKDLIDQASIFSVNESLEEISTSNLRYLATDFNLGELILKTKSQNRRGVLEKSKNHYKSFIELCDAYGLVGSTDRKAFEAADSTSMAASSLPIDPAARRNAKIAQFKREKDLKSKVESLAGSSNLDDEDIRLFHRASLSLSIMQTIQSQEMIKMELGILASAPPETTQLQPEDYDARARGKDTLEYSERLEIVDRALKGGALLSKDGKPLRPFTLVNKREQLKAGVFRSGHSLPTMSIDEYLEEERARGGIIEGGGEKSGIRPEPNEDDYEAADKETMKAREWDEYTEQNPKGSGNTLNRG